MPAPMAQIIPVAAKLCKMANSDPAETAPIVECQAAASDPGHTNTDVKIKSGATQICI